MLLSPQSRASLSKHWNITEKQVQYVLSNFFKEKGIEAVLDIELFIHLIRHWEYQAYIDKKGI